MPATPPKREGPLFREPIRAGYPFPTKNLSLLAHPNNKHASTSRGGEKTAATKKRRGVLKPAGMKLSVKREPERRFPTFTAPK